MEILNFQQTYGGKDTSDMGLDADFVLFNKIQRSKPRPLPALESQLNGAKNGTNQLNPFKQIRLMKRVESKLRLNAALGYKEICDRLFKCLELKSGLAGVKKCKEEFQALDIPLHDEKACQRFTGKPLFYAAIEKKRWDVVDYLLSFDDDFILVRKGCPMNVDGLHTSKTCLFQLVEMHGRSKKPILKHTLLTFVTKLLQTLKTWSKKTKENRAAFTSFLQESSCLSVQESRNRELSPLHVAAYFGDAEMARILLRFGVNPNVVNSYSETPLMWGMCATKPRGITSLLLQHKASTDIIATDSSMVIHWAIRTNDLEVLSMLTKSKVGDAMLNTAKNCGFQYPLIQAAAMGFDVVVEWLLNNGARANVANQGGQTALHFAAAAGNVTTIQVLLACVGNIDTEDKVGNTALMLAVSGGHLCAAQILIQQRASIYSSNQLDETVWSLAMEKRGNDMLSLLINAHKPRVLPDGTAIISPLQVATKRNNKEKLKFLLEYIDRTETDLKHKNTFAHIAAKLNNHLLLHDALIYDDPLLKARNSNQDTPLHLATKCGNVEAVRVLLTNAGRSVLERMNKTRNKARRTAFHELVCAHSPKLADLYFTNVLSEYHDKEKVSPRHESHLSALIDEVDEQRNTCLHLAVSHAHNPRLINLLVKHSRQINAQNFEGNTALHLAAMNGSGWAIQELLAATGIDLTIRNSMGRTALHTAVRAGLDIHSMNVINKLVNAIEAEDRKIFMLKDHSGNTALHIACRWDKVDAVKSLVHHGISPNTINNEGNNPLHVARFKNTKSMREALEVFQGMNLDQENYNEETVLEVYAKHGLVDHVTELIKYGADLSHLNSRQETMLHTIVRQTVLEPERFTDFRGVYKAVCQMAVHWWCLKHDLQIPFHQEMHRNLKICAVLYLMCELKDEAGLSVVNLAISKGAKELVQLILHTPEIFSTTSTVDGCKTIIYDITGLCPETFQDTMFEDKQHRPATLKPGARKDKTEKKISKQSGLDILARITDVTAAVDMMKVSPITETVDHYWRAFQWLTLRLMVVHVAYMLTFSILVYPTLEPGYHNSTGNVPVRNMTHDITFGCFLPWPLLLIVIRFAYNTADFPQLKNIRIRSGKLGSADIDSDMAKRLKRVVNWIYDSLPLIASILFPIVMVVWYIMHRYGYKYEVYILTLVLVIGWLLSISFTMGVKGVHTFCEMFRYIMIRDIMRFLFVYIFVLSAFLFSLHVLFQVVPELHERYPSSWDTLFLLFNLMIGVGELFDTDTDDWFYNAGYNPVYAKLLYIIYVILSMIIMINLLIAMVNETYESVKTREGTTWRKSTAMFAIRLERDFPILKNFFEHKLIGCLKRYAKKELVTLTLKSNQGHLQTITFGRYLMHLQKDSRLQGELMEDDELKQDSELETMKDAMEKMERKMEENHRSVKRMERNLAQIKGFVSALYNSQTLAYKDESAYTAEGSSAPVTAREPGEPHSSALSGGGTEGVAMVAKVVNLFNKKII